MTHEALSQDPWLRRELVPYLEALMLFALYALAYPWFAGWCNVHLPEVRGRWVMEEAASLALVAMAVALLNQKSLRALIGSAAREGRAAGMPAAFQALFVLGLLALAFRLIDPAFDEQEFIRRGVTAPGVLAELLAMLPFGVAAEELVFRNCQRRLRGALNPAASVLAVSLAFALYHRVPGTLLDRHEIETLLATFAGGLVLSITYERTASLSLLIVVHLSYDFLAVAQAWLNVERLRLVEAFLFLLWIGFSGLLAWGRRGAFPRRHGTLSGVMVAEAGAPDLHRSRAMPWIASLFFGAAVPFLLAWIRTRLSF